MDRLRTKGLLAAHNLWLTAAIVIVVAIAIYSRLDSVAFRNAAEGAERSRLVVDYAHRLFSLIQDAEAAQSGYLLTGNAQYLATYNEALPKIALAPREFGQLPSPEREEQKRLSALVRTKLDELAQTIRIRQQGDIPAALAIVHTDRGKQTMDEIRALVSQIVDRENREFRDLNGSAQRHGYQTRILVQIGAMVLALLLWVATRRINHLVHSQEKLIDDLDATREREERGRSALATTLRSIGDAVITTDRQGRVQFMNPVAEELTGWKGAEAEGRPLLDVFRIAEEATGHPAKDPIARVLREGVAIGLANHTTLIARDGREIPIDNSAAPIPALHGEALHGDEHGGEHGKVAGVVLVFRDVTVRRRSQRQLEESENRYRLLFQANPEPMWVYDTQSLAFLAVNHAATVRYGYATEEFLGMTVHDIHPPEDVPAKPGDTRLPAGELHTDGPLRHRKKDGTTVVVEITAHPIQFDSAQACLVMAHDITERKGLEEQLRQSQKLEAVGQLAGGIAHDFNNLLTVIAGYADMIRSAQLADDPHREPMEEIVVAAQRAASLTRQLLAFSRRQVLQPVRLSLNANVANTQRMLSRLLGEQIHIRTGLAGDLWEVCADSGQIDQIILNLAINARDAMEHGGTLTIETSNVELDANEARKLDTSPGEYVRLSLTDTGEGMDLETQRHIFEPFFTTKEVGRGTGLGLSTVYGIVKQSGGHISVTSRPGKGSTFAISLPRALGQSEIAAGAAASGYAQTTGATILLVEDDQTVQQLVHAMLKSSGYRVIPTSTPSEALRICADFSTPIDLLLTDMVLAEGDGEFVAQEAVELRPGLRVLFMSGYTEHPALQSTAFDRTTNFLQKPFTRSTLIAKVREALQ